jgi:hypothetical protein
MVHTQLASNAAVTLISGGLSGMLQEKALTICGGYSK